MAVKTGQVALNSSTSTLIVPAANSNTVYVGQGRQRNAVLSNIDGAIDVYLGLSTVTSGTGWKLAHGTSITLNLSQGDAIYGISSSSTPTVTFLETNV